MAENSNGLEVFGGTPPHGAQLPLRRFVATCGAGRLRPQGPASRASERAASRIAKGVNVVVVPRIAMGKQTQARTASWKQGPLRRRPVRSLLHVFGWLVLVFFPPPARLAQAVFHIWGHSSLQPLPKFFPVAPPPENWEFHFLVLSLMSSLRRPGVLISPWCWGSGSAGFGFQVPLLRHQRAMRF